MDELAKALKELGWDDSDLNSFFIVQSSFQNFDYNVVDLNFRSNFEFGNYKPCLLCNFELFDGKHI